MSSSQARRRRRLNASLLVGLSAGLGALALGSAAEPKLYPDDPIHVDDDRAFDASTASPIDGTNAYDFVEHTFLKRGERADVPAPNVNTLDEVPDSTWFTNRIGRRPMSIEEIVRSSNQMDTLNIDGWPIVHGKSQGVTPGYRVKDPSGDLYQVKFDPPSNPEMTSGAEVIGAALYHAIGYNVVQGNLVDIDPATIVIAPDAKPVGPDGRKRRMTRKDLDRVLSQNGLAMMRVLLGGRRDVVALRGGTMDATSRDRLAA